MRSIKAEAKKVLDDFNKIFVDYDILCETWYHSEKDQSYEGEERIVIFLPDLEASTVSELEVSFSVVESVKWFIYFRIYKQTNSKLFPIYNKSFQFNDDTELYVALEHVIFDNQVALFFEEHSPWLYKFLHKTYITSVVDAIFNYIYGSIIQRLFESKDLMLLSQEKKEKLFKYL
jgi:hypothetical protein